MGGIGHGGQEGADDQQIPLDLGELLPEGLLIRPQGRPEGPQDRVQFIHLAVGIHPRVALGHPLAAEKAGLSPIASACIDFHRRNPRSPRKRPIFPATGRPRPAWRPADPRPRPLRAAPSDRVVWLIPNQRGKGKYFITLSFFSVL